MSDEHYLKRELYQQTGLDPAIRDFLQSSCLDGIWYWDIEKSDQSWMDARFWEVLGYDSAGKADFGYEWQRILHPDDWRGLHEKLAELGASSDRTMDRELRYTHKDGTTVLMCCRCLVIRNQDGKPIRILGVQRDVTALKHAEAEAGRLASRVAAITQELDAFSYAISHDLRAPLRAVDGFSRMLVEDCAEQLDDEGKRMLGLIRGETQRMNALMGGVLTFSRLGRQKIELEAIDMHELAREVFDELAVLSPAREIRCHLHPLPMAYGARAMIRQVWVNLIGNAIKFTKERARAEIEIGALAGQDGVPVYYVKDNGVGFDMHHVGRLFSMFQQLHSAETYPGVGAGLAHVQRIMQRHEGRAWAEGQVDHGATFYFTIPSPKP